MKKAKAILKKLNLRPTLQRVAITEILLRKKEVHVTAYSLEKMLVKNIIIGANKIKLILNNSEYFEILI